MSSFFSAFSTLAAFSFLGFAAAGSFSFAALAWRREKDENEVSIERLWRCETGPEKTDHCATRREPLEECLERSNRVLKVSTEVKEGVRERRLFEVSRLLAAPTFSNSIPKSGFTGPAPRDAFAGPEAAHTCLGHPAITLVRFRADTSRGTPSDPLSLVPVLDDLARPSPVSVSEPEVQPECPHLAPNNVSATAVRQGLKEFAKPRDVKCEGRFGLGTEEGTLPFLS